MVSASNEHVENGNHHMPKKILQTPDAARPAVRYNEEMQTEAQTHLGDVTYASTHTALGL